MNQEEYLKIFEVEVAQLAKITNRKNRDYARKDNAFSNFEKIEQMTHGRIRLEDGILVRMTDKIARISNLLEHSANVKSEQITDTLQDLAVYSIILKIYLEYRLDTQSKNDIPECETRETRPRPHTLDKRDR
jgi:hypothetical protein